MTYPTLITYANLPLPVVPIELHILTNSSALETGLVACVKTVEDGRGVFDFDTAELDVSAGGNVDNAEVRTVGLDGGGTEAQLVGVYDAVGDF